MATSAASAQPSPACGAVQYGGVGAPDLLIATDFPLTAGPGLRREARHSAAAVRLVLEQRGWTAGERSVGLLSCDHASPKYGSWDPDACAANAAHNGRAPNLVAVVGTSNSGCAAIEIPILNTAPGGAVTMVSPANTYTCLTRHGPSCDPGEPRSYYPTGVRNYLRLSGNDLFQAAGLARFLRERGLRRVYVLWDGEPYGLGIARAFKNVAPTRGVRVVGSAAWNPYADGYRRLMRRVARARPAAIVLAGLVDANGAALIRDKVAVLGRNSGRVKLVASDGFGPEITRAPVGAAARGMFLVDTGLPVSRLPARGRAFVETFRTRFGHSDVDRHAPYAAQIAELALDAIAASDGSRAGVRRALFAASAADGLIGHIGFDRWGDPHVSHVRVFVAGRSSFLLRRVLRVSGADAANALR